MSSPICGAGRILCAHLLRRVDEELIGLLRSLISREWHLQQQIRLATNRPGGMVPEIYHPVLDCFLRGLPYLYRDAGAPVGTALLVEISGECGGKWFLARGSKG